MEYEETNWVNTPLNSMISILNPYWTQTLAPYEKFQNAIQAVGVDHPNVCWNLCCSIEIYQKYGIHALIDFGEELDSDFDVGYRLGQYISTEEMSNIILMREVGKHERFYANLTGSFFKKNGIGAVKNIRAAADDADLMLYLLCQAPFSQELIDIVPECLPGNEARFWETVRIAPYYFRHADYDVISVVQTLMQHQRAPAAILLLGDAVEKLQPDPQLICKMLVQAPSEQDRERIDCDSIRALIKYLQNSGAIDVKLLSEIEFFYLVWLDDDSEVTPRALEYRLANEPSCFCELMAATYKERHADARPSSISKALSDRLSRLTFPYSIIPGTDWDGNFHSDVFESWLSTVIAWAKENDRYEVSMHTVGNALSYVEFKENGLIDTAIMAALNHIENDELRSGYQLGIFNQRGFHVIDPEGKPEKELARTYRMRADAVEKVGYSRFANLLRKIAESFLKEAEVHIREAEEEFEEE